MNENILVIEYRNELVEKITDILKERHYNPIPTKSRSKGIEIANESSIDLIILDADIGDSQGLQLLETFKNEENTKGIPVILLSTPYRKMEFIEEAIGLGIDGLIFTPFDEMEFIASVNGALKLKKLFVENNKLIKQNDNIEDELNNLKDVSEEHYKSFKEAQKKYDDILNYDLETGLDNKKEFYKQFKKFVFESVRHEDTIILSCFCIDGLENIINEFGIMAAEEIILQFTKVLKDASREEDLIARLGNNEFIVAFKRMDVRLYDEKVEEIKNLVGKNELDYNGMLIKYTMSAGISYTAYRKTYHFENNIEKEISPSLLALHNAKRRGFASVYIHPTIIRK